MYIPKANQMEDRPTLLAFMRQYPFATLVSTVEGKLIASHLPLVVDDTNDNKNDNKDELLLRGHFAKANPHWRVGEETGETLIIFQTPHAYIAPAHYENPESVPTWNYVAVHAYGNLRLTTDRAATVATLETMFDSFDASYRQQWLALSDKYRASMLNGIVTFEIPVSRLEGKYKLSQNRPPGDQAGVAEWLLSQENQQEQEVGRLMQANLKAVGQ